MTELKTLKNFDKLFFYDFRYDQIEQLAKVNDCNPVAFSRELTKEINNGYRQEAINWINYLQLPENDRMQSRAVVDFIKEFFNITKEDLK